MSAELAPISPAPLTLTFTPPLGDLKAWAETPEKRRNEVRIVLPLLRRIHELVGTVSLDVACATVSKASGHLMRGLSKGNLRRKYEAYVNGGYHPGDLFREGKVYAAGDWRILIAGYRGPNQQADDFKREVRRAALANHVSIGESLQQLRERWAAGETIAGCGKLRDDGTREPGSWIELYKEKFPGRPLPKVWPRGFFPEGWSVRNLRRYGPAKGARVLAQRGLAAAKRYSPSVPRDTSRLRPLELITIDDFELDCLCVFPGDAHNRPQVGQVAGLLAIDVGTRRKLHWGLGQRLVRHEEQADGSVKTVRTGITRVDVQLLIYMLFAKFGLPDYPVTILCENAAAAISPELKLSIETLFGGRVRVERTNLIEHRNLANGFTEKGGCPWEKGWIEATFAKLWNILGAQKGYKGNNQRINGPAELDAKIRFTKILLGQGEEKITAAQAALTREQGIELHGGDQRLNLPPDEIALLRLPFQTMPELEAAFAWACQLCDSRTNHAYRGFDKIDEFRLEDGGEPQPFAALALLPPEKQLAVEMVQRMESSIERWDRLSAGVQFAAIDRSVLAIFLLTPVRAPYRNNAITFRLKGAGYTFVDEAGKVFAGVAEGTEFLCYLDQNAPDQLHITQLNGAATGTLQRLGGKRGAVDIRDKAALAAAAAVTATLRNRTLAQNRADLAEENAAALVDQEHNAQIIAAHQAETAALTPVQKLARAMTDADVARAEQRELDRAAQARANDLSAADRAEFLAGDAPASPSPAATASSANTEKLSDYL